MYDGPFCVLSLVDNRSYKRLAYRVLDHTPTQADVEDFFRGFQAVLQTRQLAVKGITTHRWFGAVSQSYRSGLWGCAASTLCVPYRGRPHSGYLERRGPSAQAPSASPHVNPKSDVGGQLHKSANWSNNASGPIKNFGPLHVSTSVCASASGNSASVNRTRSDSSPGGCHNSGPCGRSPTTRSVSALRPALSDCHRLSQIAPITPARSTLYPLGQDPASALLGQC